MEDKVKKITDIVIVTYNPDTILLKRCIFSIKEQVSHIWIVDNNSYDLSGFDDISDLDEKVSIIKLAENMGIAHAQNIGLKRSLLLNSNYIILSDQDTIYPDNYVDKMLRVFEDFSGNVSAVAPLCINTLGEKNNEGFRVSSRFGYTAIFPSKGSHMISFAIASGKIIDISTLEKIGLMDEGLFIDWVDMEWCWRSIGKGYAIIGSADTVIKHQLGNGVKNILGSDITVRNPVRHYYMVRNAIHIALNSSCLDIWHRWFLIKRALEYLLLFPVFVAPRRENLSMVIKGLYHGVLGKQGPINEDEK
jgi:rhamnosyltransferase